MKLTRLGRRSGVHLDSWQPPVRRHLAELPQGRKAARAGELCRVRGGPLHSPGQTLWTDRGGLARWSGPTVRVRDSEAPLALYSTSRPDSFGQVIGQDNVTEPLRA